MQKFNVQPEKPVHHYRHTWIEINLDAIHENVASFKSYLPRQTEMMAVVKANGYGHGAVPIAKEALLAGATWLGVALLEEAIELREAGIEAPILLLGYLASEYIPIAQTYHISVTVTDLPLFKEILNKVVTDLPALRFHLKLDTGMSRLGISEENDLLQLIDEYIQYKNRIEYVSLVWEGVYTHLSTADEEESTYLQEQIKLFKRWQGIIRRKGLTIPYIHMSNSAGIMRFAADDESNLVRLGISMYGLHPSPYMKGQVPFNLRPAFSLHTHFSLIKKVKADTGVSYGAAYMTNNEEWIGTLPIGYADGWLRKLSQLADVLVRGKRMKIIGRICMDQTMVKLDQKYSREERVTLIGKQKETEITIDELAELLNTINYEIPCMISERIPRVYLRRGS